MAGAFGPIPIRAFSDRRLSAAALRLLACYGYHDRNGRNGRACYARRSTIARETGIHYSNLNRYDRELAAYGYIQVKPNPKDQREKLVRVINDENLREEVIDSDDCRQRKVVSSDDEVADIVVKPNGQHSDLSLKIAAVRDLVKRSEETPPMAPPMAASDGAEFLTQSSGSKASSARHPLDVGPPANQQVRELKHVGTRLPDGWEPDVRDIAYGLEHGFDEAYLRSYVAPNFAEYWHNKTGKAGLKRDWNRAWQTWVRNERKFAEERRSRAEAIRANAGPTGVLAIYGRLAAEARRKGPRD